MYNSTQSGLSAEEYRFATQNDNPEDVKEMMVSGMKKYLLRPETIESLYVLYAKTKNPVFR